MDEVSAVFHLPINEAAKEVSLNLKESRARFEKRRGRRARVDGFWCFFLVVKRDTRWVFFLCEDWCASRRESLTDFDCFESIARSV